MSGLDVRDELATRADPARLGLTTKTGYDASMTVEIVTMIAALVGAVAGLLAVVGLLIVNGKVDRLTGRVDVLQDAMMRRAAP